MPGQRKRKLVNSRRAAPASDRAGRWDVVLETQDPVEFRERVRRLRTGPRPADLSELRIDTLCGRLAHPTTYRLSRYVPSDA